MRRLRMRLKRVMQLRRPYASMGTQNAYNTLYLKRLAHPDL
jgi:hypothetical protein